MMITKLPVLCPQCGASDTIRLKGPQSLTNDFCQQRHECRECGCKFLSYWQLDERKIYAPGIGKEGVA